MKSSFTNDWRKFINRQQTSNQRKSMKDMLWERKDNWKVDRMIFERVLFEGRLEQVQKKYPDYANYVDLFSKEDPSGNNKYLAKSVKLLKQRVEWYIKTFRSAQARELNAEETRNVKNMQFRSIRDLVDDFHKLNKYLPTQGGGRDLNAYKNFDDLKQAIENAQAVFQAKEAEKVHKQQMRDDADRIYQDKTTLVVRPHTEGASCYYGQGTKWCISATNSRNYWDDYSTEQGKIFFFILDKDEELVLDDLDKVALVYDSDNADSDSPYDAYDSTDEQLSSYDIVQYYDGAWDQEKQNAVFGAIQQSLDENPPEVGIDLYAELEDIQEYAEVEVARTVGEFAPDTIYFNIDVDYEDTGYEAQATVRYIYDLGYDPRNPEAAEMYPGDEVEVQEEIDSTLTQDYSEADIGFEMNMSNEEALVIDLTINAEDTFGGPNREAREQAVVNTRDFVDGVIASYGEDYEKEYEELRKKLVARKVLAPNKWDKSKDDLKRSVAELTHFMPVERGNKIAFRLVDTGDQYGENPPIGVFPKDEGIYNIFNARWSDEEVAYRSRRFSKAMEAGLDAINKEALDSAMKQLELPLGAQYKAPKEGVNPFAFTYGISTARRGNDPARLQMETSFAEDMPPAEQEKVLLQMDYLNRNFDRIIDIAKKAYASVLGDQEVAQSEKRGEIQSGKVIKGEIEKALKELNPETSSDWRTREMNDERRANNLNVVKWVQDNFEKMRPVEREAATSYIKRLNIELRRGASRDYVIPDGEEVPRKFEDEVKRALEDLGASKQQQEKYKWGAARVSESIVENIRTRVREVILENLKK
tara:strand:+ start:648 stop:3086 length:2439 start_codon:yes stop_codon:yes gene_type:complete